ncbi:hypothetical protein FA13DRAFT_1042515 [Coprinellus micaceus]|uniref:Uncharacterized protein n=1 Tax=Coprinellus micaceus TaxID=71717 RepID=A0A4Y7SXD2_COPMI|nr:hypothetical protein FA13DRAFT_1042515 [Coprinellus micaceus]
MDASIPPSGVGTPTHYRDGDGDDGGGNNTAGLPIRLGVGLGTGGPAEAQGMHSHPPLSEPLRRTSLPTPSPLPSSLFSDAPIPSHALDHRIPHSSSRSSHPFDSSSLAHSSLQIPSQRFAPIARPISLCYINDRQLCQEFINV